MLFSGQITHAQLAGLCTRLSTSLNAGLDLRTVWAQEARRARLGPMRRAFTRVAEAVADGATLREALDAAGDYFPLLFREMVLIADESGRLDDTLADLARQYEFQVQMQRGFLIAIAWPVFELAAAVVVVGVLIVVLGVLSEVTGQTIDTLGWGLTGWRGLFIYCAFLAIIGTGAFLLYRAFRLGLAWSAPLQIALLKLPTVGHMLNYLALARIAWSMALTFNSAMDVRRAVRLTLQAAAMAPYAGAWKRIDAALVRGGTLVDAFSAPGVFPEDFLTALHVGEQSGNIPEMMTKMAAEYQSRAKLSSHALSVIGFFAVMGLVVLVIGSIIFRLASFHVNMINDALKM